MPLDVLQIMVDSLKRGIGCWAWATTNTPLGLSLADLVEDPLEASPLCSKVPLADSVEDPLEASPLCSKVALADPVEDPLEASPLCSKVASRLGGATSPKEVPTRARNSNKPCQNVSDSGKRGSRGLGASSMLRS